jgi:hypothetical protein
MAGSVKMGIFWDVAAHSLVNIYRRFRGDGASTVTAMRHLHIFIFNKKIFI